MADSKKGDTFLQFDEGNDEILLRRTMHQEFVVTRSEEVVLRRDKKTQKNVGTEKVKTHPDGGWGWVVVIAAFLTQFIVVGLQNSSGVIFNKLVEKFDRPRGQTGFVSSISCGMMFILGPVTTSLCQKFGCRAISIIGGLLCSLGMFASAYASSLEIMYVTFGFTWGLGTSFCYFPTLIILVPYFNKRLALVNGLVSSGSGIGTLILSPFLSWFADKYGVKNMFFMLSALHGIVFFASFVYRPISDHYKILQGRKVKTKEKKEPEPQRQYTQETLLSVKNGTWNVKNRIETRSNKIIYESTKDIMRTEEERTKRMKNIVLFSLMRDKAFLTWCIGLAVFMLGYFVPFVHLVRYANLIGISEVKGAFLISVLSIVATVFKVLSGKIAGLKRVDTFKLYQFGLLTMGVATTLIPVSKSYTGLVIYSVVFGICESCFIVMIPLITKDIVGVRRLPLALGCVFMLMGIPTVVGAPIAGWIYDAFHDYSYAFYVAGSMNTLGVLIIFLVVLFREDKITTFEKCVIKEDKQERPTSKIIEYACYSSSERIYYSELDLFDVEEYFNNNTKFKKASNTSLNEIERVFKCEPIKPYKMPISPLALQDGTPSKQSYKPPPQINRPESPTITLSRMHRKKRMQKNSLKLWAELMHENRRREEVQGENRYSFCSLDSNYFVLDSIVTAV